MYCHFPPRVSLLTPAKGAEEGLHYWHFSSPDHQPDSSSVQVARCFLGELRFHSEKRPLSLHCCIQDTWPSGKGITQTEVIYTITVPTKEKNVTSHRKPLLCGANGSETKLS
uniref:Uncharacterized protein n=1 Tax=Astatotilapia calliptera TaxID=8154 RepID=A0A3P8RAJ7_ASTCA